MQFTRYNDTGIFTMQADVTPLTKLWYWLKYESVATERDPDIVIPFVRAFGQDTWQNFRNEKWPGWNQDWAPLKSSTIGTRIERGYPGPHPILRESGQLADLSSSGFRDWRWGQMTHNRSATAPYEDEDGTQDTLNVNASIRGGEFSAQISGARVRNQYAYRVSRSDGSAVGVPPRPFWGLTTDMIERALPSSIDRFMMSWAKRKPEGIE